MHSSNTPVNSRDTPVHTSDTPASAIDISASSGAPFASPHPKKSRRRRKRRNRRSANENSAPRSATPVTPDERWANRNSAFQRATRHQSEASDPTQMMSTPVYQEQSFHSSHLPPPNRNAAFQFGLDRCRFPGLYKPAHPDPRQDLTATPSRVNNSGSGFSSHSLLKPYTKPFSGRPARPQMTCTTREAGEAIRERPGVVFPLQPRAQRPDTRVVIEAALPEAAVLDRRAQPPTVVEIGDTSLPLLASSPRRHAS